MRRRRWFAGGLVRVLICDDFDEMREFLDFVLSAELAADCTTTKSPQEAISRLSEDGSYDLIISELNFHNSNGIEILRFCEKKGLKIPFLGLAGDRQSWPQQTSPSRLRIIKKPFDLSEMLEAICDILGDSVQTSQQFVPVSLPLLRKMESVDVPLFVRLNELKFIKVTSHPILFTESEYEKYQQRGLRYLYVEAREADNFIQSYRKKILSLSAWHEASTEDHELISLNTELLKNLSGLMGWDQKTVDLAKHSLTKALHLVRTNPGLHQLMNQFQKIERMGFADHCTMDLLIAIGIVKHMGYSDEMTYAKLTFASVLHDLALRDLNYAKKDKLAKRLRTHEAKTEDEKVVWSHTLSAAEICRRWDFCPPEVDKIIENHHESPTGDGFPGRKRASDLDFLSCVFIVAEDFTTYFMESLGKPEWNFYLESRSAKFQSGHFRTAFRTLESAIELQNKKVA